MGRARVSVAAAAATLALLVAWGSAAHSRAAGWLAALMLATSLQFLVSSHWVLIDPLLMFCTTLAPGRPGSCWRVATAAALRLLFYLALVLSLWIKGLIGPVLIVAGLLGYVLIDRPAHWRRLRPIVGISVLALAVLLLALAIWTQGGNAALWEWAYVNHVQRLLNPRHHRPSPAVALLRLDAAATRSLPWLPPLIEALRPAHWRRVRVAGLPPLGDPARYGALMSAAMLLLLSLSATKRETYLLPMLPLAVSVARHSHLRVVAGTGSCVPSPGLGAALVAAGAAAEPVCARGPRGRPGSGSNRPMPGCSRRC